MEIASWCPKASGNRGMARKDIKMPGKCISYFSVDKRKDTHKGNLRKEGSILVYSFRVQYMMVGKSCQQHHEEAAHFVSTVKKQGEGWMLLLSHCYSIQCRILTHGMALP